MPSKDKLYTNIEISQYLQDIATAYEIKKKNFFRINSYQNAADIILTYPNSVQEIWKNNPKNLDNIPSIGPHILKKIDFLLRYNIDHPDVTKAFKGIHPSVFTFTKINGIGPKIAYLLTRKLKFSQKPLLALNQLIKYAQEGKIRNISRLGQKSEQSILKNTLVFLGKHKRLTFDEANEIAKNIISYMKEKFTDVEFITLGSLRRHTTTIGDIDIAAKSENIQDILNYFILYPNNIQTISKGDKKASIRVYKDIRVDLMVQPEKSFGSLVQHFTGSRQHNIILRKYAQSLGLSVSEYGIKDLKTGKIHTFENEKDIYQFLNLKYIEPEKRVGENELEKL